MKLYVLRHGQTNYNKEGRFQGQDDICLNEQGIIETKEIAKILGIPLTTVLSKYNRTIKKIKRKLGEERK